MTTFKTTMDAEAQKRADYLAAIGRALPDDGIDSWDDIEFEPMTPRDAVKCLLWFVLAALCGVAVVAFLVGMTQP